MWRGAGRIACPMPCASTPVPAPALPASPLLTRPCRPRPPPCRQVCERYGGLEQLLATLAAAGAPERLRLQLVAVMAGRRLRPGGAIEGEEGGADDEDSADPADDDELYGMLPPMPEGGMPFASTGSTPD